MVMQLEGIISQSIPLQGDQSCFFILLSPPTAKGDAGGVPGGWEAGRFIATALFLSKWYNIPLKHNYVSKSIQMETLGRGKEDCGEQSRHRQGYLVG